MKQIESTRILRSSSARRKNNTLDRISALPDSILGLILSYLPTKNAVATTILSQRWKFVWMTIHNLDFCLKDLRRKLPEDTDMKFSRFVNHVLLLHDGGLLNKFRLVWRPRCIPNQVSSWITAAITRNVHHLCVSVRSFHSKALEVPISLFICGSLQCLELDGDISFSAEIVVCLPRLETLKLVSVYFLSEEAIVILMSGCPVLNYLHLDMTYSKGNNKFTYSISSTSLRRLELFVGRSWFDNTPILQLEASSLEYLKLGGSISRLFVQGTLSSLVEAHFNLKIQFWEHQLSEDICNSVAEAVRAFDCAKALTLSMDVMWALTKSTVSLSTKFSRLTKLEAGSFSCYCSSLQDFIQSSDNLEVLTIYQDSGKLDLSSCHPSNWTAPVEVPRCLSNSLKAVAIEGYRGYDGEREMIRYMLKHGSALEVMQITCHRRNNEKENLELVKKICRFPRKSLCEVECIA